MLSLSRASRMRKSSGDRFWPKVQKGDGCWEWTGSRDRRGYGQFSFERHPVLAHRMAYYLTYGPFEGSVLHACDNPPCVRPDHLHLGTQKDNMGEASQRGRIYNLRKTHCGNGHPYDEENTRLYQGRRYCRACESQWKIDWRRRQGQVPRSEMARDAKGRILPRVKA